MQPRLLLAQYSAERTHFRRLDGSTSIEDLRAQGRLGALRVCLDFSDKYGDALVGSVDEVLFARPRILDALRAADPTLEIRRVTIVPAPANTSPRELDPSWTDVSIVIPRLLDQQIERAQHARFGMYFRVAASELPSPFLMRVRGTRFLVCTPSFVQFVRAHYLLGWYFHPVDVPFDHPRFQEAYTDLWGDYPDRNWPPRWWPMDYMPDPCNTAEGDVHAIRPGASLSPDLRTQLKPSAARRPRKVPLLAGWQPAVALAVREGLPAEIPLWRPWFGRRVVVATVDDALRVSTASLPDQLSGIRMRLDQAILALQDLEPELTREIGSACVKLGIVTATNPRIIITGGGPIQPTWRFSVDGPAGTGTINVEVEHRTITRTWKAA